MEELTKSFEDTVREYLESQKRINPELQPVCIIVRKSLCEVYNYRSRLIQDLGKFKEDATIGSLFGLPLRVSFDPYMDDIDIMWRYK